MNSLRRKGVDVFRQSINEPAMMARASGVAQNEDVALKLCWQSQVLIKDGQSLNHSSAADAKLSMEAVMTEQPSGAVLKL